MGTIITPQGAFPLLWFLTTSLNLRDSQSVKPKAFRKRLCMYMSRPPVITQSSLLTVGHLSQGLSAFRKDTANIWNNYESSKFLTKKFEKSSFTRLVETVFCRY